jgi:hypothetical protein
MIFRVPGSTSTAWTAVDFYVDGDLEPITNEAVAHRISTARTVVLWGKAGGGGEVGG